MYIDLTSVNIEGTSLVMTPDMHPKTCKPLRLLMIWEVLDPASSGRRLLHCRFGYINCIQYKAHNMLILTLQKLS